MGLRTDTRVWVQSKDDIEAAVLGFYKKLLGESSCQLEGIDVTG